MCLCNASCRSHRFPFLPSRSLVALGDAGPQKKSTDISRHHEIKTLCNPHRAMSPSVRHCLRGTSSGEVCQEGRSFCTEPLAHVSCMTAFTSGSWYLSAKQVAKRPGYALICKAATRRGWQLSPGTDLPGGGLSWRQAWAGAGVPHSYQIPHLAPLHLEASGV